MSRNISKDLVKKIMLKTDVLDSSIENLGDISLSYFCAFSKGLEQSQFYIRIVNYYLKVTYVIYLNIYMIFHYLLLINNNI